MAYATLLGHVAEMGQVLVVDPYLKPEQLFSFLQHTNANRFLIGSRVNNGAVVAVQTLLSSTGWATTPQLRQADPGDLHDRYVVGDTQVYTLGMSLNAVGRTNTTVLMPLPDDASDHVRGVVESLWTRAQDLAPPEAPPGTQGGDDNETAPARTAVQPLGWKKAAPKNGSVAEQASTKKRTVKKATTKKAVVKKSTK